MPAPGRPLPKQTADASCAAAAVYLGMQATRRRATALAGQQLGKLHSGKPLLHFNSARARQQKAGAACAVSAFGCRAHARLERQQLRVTRRQCAAAGGSRCMQAAAGAAHHGLFIAASQRHVKKVRTVKQLWLRSPLQQVQQQKADAVQPAHAICCENLSKVLHSHGSLRAAQVLQDLSNSLLRLPHWLLNYGRGVWRSSMPAAGSEDSPRCCERNCTCRMPSDCHTQAAAWSCKSWHSSASWPCIAAYDEQHSEPHRIRGAAKTRCPCCPGGSQSPFSLAGRYSPFCQRRRLLTSHRGACKCSCQPSKLTSLIQALLMWILPWQHH